MSVVADYAPEHLAELHMREDVRATIQKFNGGAKLLQLSRVGLCRTILGRSGPLAVVAAVPLGLGAAEVMLIGSDGQNGEAMTLARGAKECLRLIRNKFSDIRAIAKDGEPYSRFLSFLGFAPRGSVHRPEFGPGVRMLLWGLQ